MKNWLNNEYVVLSGASGGIGRQLCKILIEKYNANVVGIGRNEEKMRSLKQELGEKANKFTYRLFDVSEQTAWQDFKSFLEEQEITPILLINNAGMFPTFTKASETPEEVTARIMQVNYFSHVYACNALLPVLRGKDNYLPAVVNVSSCAALCTVVGTGIYSASKAALKSYTEALMLEEKGKLYVGLICPGTTATELFDGDENTKDSALNYIAMPAEKMATKIAKKILRRKKRAVLGIDAKLMSFCAKILPIKGLFLVRGVMKTSKSKVFKNVFDYKK